MQGISSQNRISVSSVSSAAKVSTTPSGSSGRFLNSLRGVSDAAINRFTVHAAPSSPWNYNRCGDSHLSKSSASTSPKASSNTTKEALKAEYKKNASEYRRNPSAFRGVSNHTAEKCKQYHYDKASHPSN